MFFNSPHPTSIIGNYVISEGHLLNLTQSPNPERRGFQTIQKLSKFSNKINNPKFSITKVKSPKLQSESTNYKRYKNKNSVN